jgi:limonene-1,2-epoxide hydrolase
MNDAHAVADALGRAMNTLDARALQAIYADDITVWHGATGAAMGKAENIAMLSALYSIASSLEYINIKRHDIAGGLVQQHQLIGTLADGSTLPALNACLVIKVDSGQITSIEEYFDASTFADVWPRLALAQSA